MNLSVNSYGLNFGGAKKLIPLSKYKGPILKLTEADKAEISRCRQRLADLELNLHKLEAQEKKSTSTRESYYYFDEIQKYLFDIDTLRTRIENIKIARLNKQKETSLELV